MEQSVRRQIFFFRIERVRRRVRYRCDELVETNRSIARSFGLLRVRASTEPSKMVLLPLSAFFSIQFLLKKLNIKKLLFCGASGELPPSPPFLSTFSSPSAGRIIGIVYRGWTCAPFVYHAARLARILLSAGLSASSPPGD